MSKEWRNRTRMLQQQLVVIHIVACDISTRKRIARTYTYHAPGTTKDNRRGARALHILLETPKNETTTWRWFSTSNASEARV